MTILPSILIAGAHNFDADQIIKTITKIENSPKNELIKGLSAYKWQINNKYYTADVNLCSISIDTPLEQEFKESVEALIIYFDITKENCFAELNDWLNYTNDCDISEKVLVCKSTSGLDEVQKDAVDDWCIENKYELVQLDQKIENDDPEDFIKECVGIDRVIEILHSHEWPNLTIKGNTANNTCPLDVENDLKDWDLISSAINEFSSQSCPVNNGENEDEQIDEKEFENMEQLTLLFKNLQSMKKEISSLQTGQKHDQAEKVVKAFWNAIGGDADEFSDSDEGACT